MYTKSGRVLECRGGVPSFVQPHGEVHSGEGKKSSKPTNVHRCNPDSTQFTACPRVGRIIDLGQMLKIQMR
ncbi:MAG: hypothetical protein QF609_08395, partial [Gammaproteobacteria bacterium]|nr:hypothetical protein [Gammaproteobacteria bacterium]